MSLSFKVSREEKKEFQKNPIWLTIGKLQIRIDYKT